jgi:hypothetical protein
MNPMISPSATPSTSQTAHFPISHLPDWERHRIDVHFRISSMPQRFRLNASIIATESRAGWQEIVYLPEGAEILVMDPISPSPSDPPNRQVSVEWEHHLVTAFAVDIQERGKPLRPS